MISQILPEGFRGSMESFKEGAMMRDDVFCLSIDEESGALLPVVTTRRCRRCWTRAIEMQPIRVANTVRASTVEQANPLVERSHDRAKLPSGWSVVRDAKSNADYYYNSETDATSLSVPLHVGWSAQTGDDGSTHYIHTPSCAWQSTVPTEADTIAAVKVALNIALPRGWVAISNSVYGVYYANPVSVSAS